MFIAARLEAAHVNYNSFLRSIVSLKCLLVCCACTQSSAVMTPATQEGSSQDVYAITNVTVIPMTLENRIHDNVTVVVKDRKIVSLNGAIPPNAERIDGQGKWLIPGLIDMHVHSNADINFLERAPTAGASFFMDTQHVMTTFVASGVTTIFDLSSRAEHFGQRNEIAKGAVIGPRMALAALIDGGEGDGRRVNTDYDARQAVRSAKAEGYSFIKLYSNLSIDAYRAAIDEAHLHGMKVVGHIPIAFRGSTDKAFIPHFGMVAHTEEFSKQTNSYTDADARRFARLAKDNNTWVTPTLTTMVWIASQLRSLEDIRLSDRLKYVHPLIKSKWLSANNYHNRTSPEFIEYVDDLLVFQNKLIRAFKEAGVPIVAGTDAGTSGVVTGFSLHDELGLMVAAGMTEKEVLVAATRLPAEWLGIDAEVGTVEVGKFADLILLEKNPLERIGNTQEIAGVFFNGRWLNRSKIDAMLLDLETWNAEPENAYDWKSRREN